MRTFLVALVLVGCGESVAVFDGQGDVAEATNASALTTETQLSFQRDWRIVRSSDLMVGGFARVAYDSERLPQCREEQAGQPLWSITGFWRLAGRTGSFEAGGHSPSNHTSAPLIPLEGEGELEVWFQVTSRSGCTAWDSN
jgi:hypothetical protein